MTSGHTPRPRARRLLVGAALLALLAGGLGAAGSSTGPAPAVAATTAGALVPRPDHVVVVVMENKNRTSVIGSAQAPYVNALAARGANLSQSYGVTHPSQPNYVALFSGGQQGVTTNACRDLGATANLGSQLRSAGLTFTGYAESLPAAGWTGCRQGDYERKHNPWVDFSNLPTSVNQPFSAFPENYADLPTVSFVTPNMCHDMHNCSVATGDTWLQKNLDGYARWAMTHNSLLVVTFDENAGGTVNQIATVVVGQKVRPGLYAEWMNHYTLLRTLEDAYGLAPLGFAAQATPLRTIWTTAPKPRTGASNGTFEGGLASWASSGKTTTSVNNVHGGERAGRAGALTATRGDSILSQTFVVPAGRSRLSVWWQGRCSDTVGKAWATVVLKRNTSSTKSTLLPRTCARKGAWTKVGVRVTPGHSYTLQLVNHDDGAAATPNRTYFDDVTLS
ncbi:Phosphoesterase family protein [Friedmanniella luteola]|uniref:phospholipase C n=1 Tax=Friedmanniella luteola TaxID=546871 RepID=A0A1H1UM32_9ACTN|nr:alkaline phosphatase family protein [Friedmanniella luteola]SDS72879.1 Phosphoesterase family protein [Friedmanniella luteola]